LGTSKSRGYKGCTISLIGYGASGAYAPGPDDEEEEEEEEEEETCFVCVTNIHMWSRAIAALSLSFGHRWK